MAEHKVKGGDMLLFIDPAGGTAYDTVVCLTQVSKDDQVSEVDSSSACGADSSPGVLSHTRTFEGQHLQDPTTGKISGTSLRILMYNKTTIGYMIARTSADLETGDEIEVGTGYISALSSTYAFDSVGTFSGTIKPFGTPAIVEES